MKLVPNKEIREAFLRSGLQAADVANFCGWLRKNGMPDTTKLNRSLGIESQKNKDGTHYRNTRMAEQSALEVIEALNLDPVDFRDSDL